MDYLKSYKAAKQLVRRIPMEKAQVKEAIKQYEYYKNNFHMLNGHGVTVKNLKINKSEAMANIVLYDAEEGESSRYNNCRYPLTELAKYIK